MLQHKTSRLSYGNSLYMFRAEYLDAQLVANLASSMPDSHGWGRSPVDVPPPHPSIRCGSVLILQTSRLACKSSLARQYCAAQLRNTDETGRC